MVSFDNIPQDLLIRAVKKHARERWMVLYIERWLKASVQEEDGQLVPREKGTPQGGVISPLLANLFLHYVFDRWMAKWYRQLPFERFADDAIVHCRTEQQAQEVRAAIAARLKDCGLELHPEKTKVVYCKDDDRRGTYLNEKFDFLGYTFRPRRSKNRHGKHFVNFSPAVSDKAVKAIRTEIRSWNLHLRSDKTIEDLSRMFNPIIRGWLRYYGRFYRSALYPPMRQLDRSLARWAERKYKKLRRHLRRATHWVARISRRDPAVVGALADGCAAWLHSGSRMSGDVHVRFCEGLGVRLPGATHLIVHCRTEREANLVRVKVAARLKQCGLELHPEKTKVVYCKDANRGGTHRNEKFDFLGFTFRPRKAYGRKGKPFCSFSPAISNKAAKKIRDEIRGWKLHRCTGQSIQDLARKINPKLRGWFNYYGRFTASALRSIERHVGQSLVRWACRKYKKLRNHRSRAWAWLMQVLDRQPNLLALWEHQRSRFFTIGAV